MIRPDNHPLPFPLDARQSDLLREMDFIGCVIASPGSERFEELDHLVDQGLAKDTHCPNAMGVHQFEITAAGREAIA